MWTGWGKIKHFGLREVNGLMKRGTYAYPISADPPPLPSPLFPFRGKLETKTANCTLRNLHAHFVLKLSSSGRNASTLNEFIVP